MSEHRMRESLLEDGDTIYSITNRREFIECGQLPIDIIRSVFDFAFRMTFGGEGHHRSHRTGGLQTRTNGQKFENTFLGKLAEFAFYQEMRENGINLSEPDVEVQGVSEWDLSDFIYCERNIAIKATKHYGNLMLLEARDWSEEGEYKPNIGNSESIYDYFVLVRIRGRVDEILRDYDIYNSEDWPDDLVRENLEEEFLSENYFYEITGYMTNETLKALIARKYILPQHSYLNTRNTRMDATNYYIQTGSLRNKESLIREMQDLYED